MQVVMIEIICNSLKSSWNIRYDIVTMTNTSFFTYWIIIFNVSWNNKRYWCQTQFLFGLKTNYRSWFEKYMSNQIIYWYIKSHMYQWVVFSFNNKTLQAIVRKDISLKGKMMACDIQLICWISHIVIYLFLFAISILV